MSGRNRSPAKGVGPEGPQRFESSTLRRITLSRSSAVEQVAVNHLVGGPNPSGTVQWPVRPMVGPWTEEPAITVRVCGWP